MPKQVSALISLVFLCALATAQDSISVNQFVSEARSNAVKSYYKFTGNQARLYNGTDHTGYLSSIKGLAYYVNDTLANGSVVYDGLLYDNVPMLYDVYKNEVVILHFSGLKISLLSEKLKEFDFRGHHFIRLVYDSLAKSTVPTGFYDLVYRGDFTMMIRWNKRLEEKVTDEVIREFVNDDRYYIVRDGVYLNFKGQHGLLSVFKDHAAAVRRYLKKNGIKFRFTPELAIVEASKYYATFK